MKTKIYLFLFFCIIAGQISAQEEKKKLKDIFSIQGYIKFLPSASFTSGDDILTNNLIHNRINVKGYFSSNWTLKVELRNRIFFGETTKVDSLLRTSLGNDDGIIDLSLLWLNKKAILGNSFIDRAQLNFSKNKWDITLGRQRINWGLTLFWNTNDLFNAYNFVDFDYIERPGSDALRIQYYATDISSIELAYKPGDDFNHTVLAALYKLNKWNYDFQLLLANYNADLAIGSGWAGNLKKVGFKGEMTFFHPKNDTISNEAFAASIGFDYAFKGGLYFNIGSLFNSSGIGKIVNNTIPDLTSSTLDAKNLMPTKFSHFVQINGAFNPMISSSLSVIYGQGLHFLFIVPNVTCAIKNNWDLDLTGQILLAPKTRGYGNWGNSLFLRLTYSY